MASFRTMFRAVVMVAALGDCGQRLAALRADGRAGEIGRRCGRWKWRRSALDSSRPSRHWDADARGRSAADARRRLVRHAGPPTSVRQRGASQALVPTQRVADGGAAHAAGTAHRAGSIAGADLTPAAPVKRSAASRRWSRRPTAGVVLAVGATWARTIRNLQRGAAAGSCIDSVARRRWRMRRISTSISKRWPPSRQLAVEQVVAKVEAWRTARSARRLSCGTTLPIGRRSMTSLGHTIAERRVPVSARRWRIERDASTAAASGGVRRWPFARLSIDSAGGDTVAVAGRIVGPPQPAGGGAVSGPRAAVAAQVGPIGQSCRWHRGPDLARRACGERYDERGCAFQVAQVAGGYQLLSRPKFAPWLRPLAAGEQEIRLSPPALETLAVVAYRQPVLRAEVEAIRGVACGEILRQLMDRDLLRIVGRSEELGRPLWYGTTKRFLEVFGLCNLDQLPLGGRIAADDRRSTHRAVRFADLILRIPTPA